MAFRLEALGDRWLCTALELGTRMERGYAPARSGVELRLAHDRRLD
jgi:hypothetical protein